MGKDLRLHGGVGVGPDVLILYGSPSRSNPPPPESNHHHCITPKTQCQCKRVKRWCNCLCNCLTLSLGWRWLYKVNQGRCFVPSPLLSWCCRAKYCLWLGWYVCARRNYQNKSGYCMAYSDVWQVGFEIANTFPIYSQTNIDTIQFEPPVITASALSQHHWWNV